MVEVFPSPSPQTPDRRPPPQTPRDQPAGQETAMPQSLFPRRPGRRYVPTLEPLEARRTPSALPVGLPIVPSGPIINFPTVDLPSPGTGTPSANATVAQP